jgi:hypothetical protein
MNRLQKLKAKHNNDNKNIKMLISSNPRLYKNTRQEFKTPPSRKRHKKRKLQSKIYIMTELIIIKTNNSQELKKFLQEKQHSYEAYNTEEQEIIRKEQ